MASVKKQDGEMMDNEAFEFEKLLGRLDQPEIITHLLKQFAQAKSGNSKAMVEVALFYKENSHFEHMYFWLLEAEKSQDADAYYELANCYFEGVGVEEQIEKAFYYYECASKLAHPDAMNNLADMYLNGEGTAIDEELALVWFLKAAYVGVVEAMYTLGIMYEQGLGTEVDDQMAFNYYEKSANGGYEEALYRMGMIYFSGELHQQLDEKRAVEWFIKAADKFHVDALYNLGYCFHYGSGVEQNSDQAIRYYKQAAVLGDVESMNRLAELYEQTNPLQAKKWREKVKRNNNNAY